MTTTATAHDTGTAFTPDVIVVGAGLAGLVAVLVLINASNGDDPDPVPVSPS